MLNLPAIKKGVIGSAVVQGPYFIFLSFAESKIQEKARRNGWNGCCSVLRDGGREIIPKAPLNFLRKRMDRTPIFERIEERFLGGFGSRGELLSVDGGRRVCRYALSLMLKLSWIWRYSAALRIPRDFENIT